MQFYLIVFTTPLPDKQAIDPDVFFYVESIAYQEDELFLTDITITESSTGLYHGISNVDDCCFLQKVE